jgi:hypothetical protein
VVRKDVKATYLETITLIERLHRQCLEVVKADLERNGVRDLNNVQALILFNIGEDEYSVGELTQRGHYLARSFAASRRCSIAIAAISTGHGWTTKA